VKQLACLVGLFAVLALVPVCVDLSAKESPAHQQDRPQGELLSQKQTPGQRKEAPAQASNPSEGQVPQSSSHSFVNTPPPE
jgi:hypothetical protein